MYTTTMKSPPLHLGYRMQSSVDRERANSREDAVHGYPFVDMHWAGEKSTSGRAKALGPPRLVKPERTGRMELQEVGTSPPVALCPTSVLSSRHCHVPRARMGKCGHACRKQEFGTSRGHKRRSSQTQII